MWRQLGTAALAAHSTPMTAYMALQLAVMQRYVSHGGSADTWCTRHAERFRRKFGWMVTDHGLADREDHPALSDSDVVDQR